jgi:hypothetical protein
VLQDPGICLARQSHFAVPAFVSLEGNPGDYRMGASAWTALPWGLVAIQIAGLISAWLARLSEGSRGQGHFQIAFFACMVLVGLGTIVSLSLPPGRWLFSGATLSLMVLAAVWDFGGLAHRHAS